MAYYIKVENGQAVDHPITEENLIQAFPGIDINNLPPEFAVFERVGYPVLGPYEIYTGHTYENNNGVFRDVHSVREMTSEEKTAKQDQVRQSYARTGFVGWVFNETTCTFDPPVPFPENPSQFMWDNETQNWVPYAPPQQP